MGRCNGIDPDRLVAGGGSAGGHVAAATGTVKEFNEKGEKIKEGGGLVALTHPWPSMLRTLYKDDERYVAQYWSKWGPEKDRFWKLIDHYGVSIFYTAPTAIRTFMKWGERSPQARQESPRGSFTPQVAISPGSMRRRAGFLISKMKMFSGAPRMSAGSPTIAT